jgi:UDP-N-acetylmuramate--alanine ligase
VAGRVEPVFVDRVDQVPQAILEVVRPGDVVLTMGAGSIGTVAAQLARAVR